MAFHTCYLQGLLLLLLGTSVALGARLARDGKIKTPQDHGSAEQDRVHSLPGWGNITNFKMFSGYFTVHERHQRRLFYVLTESQQNATTDPVILWLNGGPGCSSVGGGFMSELGPWYPTASGNLVNNPHSWNKFANVIFLESPAFVGFSYSRHLDDTVVGDDRTARDNLKFLLLFYQRFPHLRANRLWLSGESYAGHYVPQLASQVLRYNDCVKQARTASPPLAESAYSAAAAACAGFESDEVGGQLELSLEDLPIEGLTLGNAWTDAIKDNQGTVDHWWTHALISDQSFEGIRKYCNFAKSNPLDPHPDHDDPKGSVELCDHFCHQADQEMGSIDIYDVIADDCLPPRAWGEAARLGHLLTRANSTAGLGVRAAARKGIPARVQRAQALAAAASKAARDKARGSRQQHVAEEEGAARRSTLGSGVRGAEGGSDDGPDQPAYDPCVEDWTEVYLNRADVQHALHANESSNLVTWPWVFCAHHHILQYQEADLQISMLPIYDNILTRTPSLRILLYSGDADASVPALGTRYWLSALRLRQKTEVNWRTWRSSTGQVGGYVSLYHELTFATVRAAGHMVPYSQPERAHFLVSHFVQSRELPR